MADIVRGFWIYALTRLRIFRRQPSHLTPEQIMIPGLGGHLSGWTADGVFWHVCESDHPHDQCACRDCGMVKP